jgi:hypothetical protein
MRSLFSPFAILFLFLQLGLGLTPLCSARQLTLLGLADMRGSATFRTVRKTTLKSDSSTSFEDLTPSGLRAGTVVIDETEPWRDHLDRTEETRTIFRPTIFHHEGGFQRFRVLEVSFQMGGAMGSIERVTQMWGPTQSGTPSPIASSAKEIFELPTTSIAASDLTTMFQSILDRGGDGTSTEGFMIKSSEPPESHGPFHVRFSVLVEDAVPWVINGRILTQGQAPPLPNKLVLEFKSSRRGRASMTVNGSLRIQGFPVAARFPYRLDIGSPGTGQNTVLLEIEDPSDGSSQSLSLSFTN